MKNKSLEDHINEQIATSREAVILTDENGDTVGIATPHTEVNTGDQLAFDYDTGGTIIADLTADFISGDPDYDPSTPVYVWADPVIFDDDTKKLFLEMPQSERPRFTIELLDRFYDARPEYKEFAKNTIYKQPMALLNLFKSITPEDMAELEIGNADSRYKQLQQKIKRAEKAIERRPIDTTKLSTIWPILSIRELFLESEISAFYYLKNPPVSSRQLAKQLGAVGSVGGRQAIISNTKYRGYLDTKPNRYAYISYVGPRYWDNIEVDEGGNLYEGAEADVLRKVWKQNKQHHTTTAKETEKQPKPESINKNLAGALFAAILKTSERRGNEFTIYLPEFAREMDSHYYVDVDDYDDQGKPIEPQPKEETASTATDENDDKRPIRPSIIQDLRSLDRWVGVLHETEARRLLVIVGMNKAAKTLTITTPYFDSLARAVEEDQQRAIEETSQAKKKPNYNKLIHTTMATERNQTAVELVVRITNGLLDRGGKPTGEFKENVDTADGKPTPDYSISFERLINEVPDLRRRYEATKQTADKNKLLKRVFSKAYKLLHTKTDAYQYFIDLKVPETIPTTTTLSSKLIIKYSGTNPKYKKS